MGVASLVLGIISIVLAVVGGFCGMGWIGTICGIVGIILGAVALKDPVQGGKAKAGLICSVIALSYGIICTIACVACAGALATM